MKERPILFSGPMVRAIREDRKTMTRRVIKEFPITGYRWGGWILESSNQKEKGMATIVPEGNDPYNYTGSIKKRCPHGNPGDRLWIREAFVADEYMGCRYKADGKQFLIINGEKTEKEFVVKKWTPSIYMPRWASRTTIEITKIRVERLRDITEEDALNEGIIRNADGFFLASDDPKAHHFLRQPHLTAKGAFRTLWESINGHGSWDANPWVWVEEFKRVQK